MVMWFSSTHSTKSWFTLTISTDRKLECLLARVVLAICVGALLSDDDGSCGRKMSCGIKLHNVHVAELQSQVDD